MIEEIRNLTIKIQDHIKKLETSEEYKFYKQKDEIILSSNLFLMHNPLEKLKELPEDTIKSVHATFIEIEKNLQGLFNV